MTEKSYSTCYLCRNFKLRYALSLFVRDRLFKRRSLLIYYLNPSRSSYFFEKIGKWLPIWSKEGFSVMHLDCDISKMKNEKGIPVIKASGCDDLNEIANKIDKMELDEGRPVLDCLNKKLSHLRKDLRLYIKQQVVLENFNDLLMANMAHWLSTNRESELYGKNPVLLIEKKSYWSYLILDYLKSKNVSFKVFRQLNFKKNKGILFTYHLIKLLVELARSLAAGQIWKDPSGKVKIGISSYVNQNFTNYFDIKNYYLFWFYKSEIDPENILIYVPEAKFELSDREVSNIKKANFNILYCPTRITRKGNNPVPVYLCSFNAAILLIQYLKQILVMFRSVKNKSTLEQWKILSVLLIQLPYWEDFFTKNNIKIKFRFHDIFSVRDIAAKLSGVVTLSYHYSNHSDARITREEVCDTFFIWGNPYKKCLSPVHSTCKYLIKTGYMFDNTFNNLKEKATDLRDKFKICGVSYIIGIFSENMSGYLGKAQFKFYMKILEFAVQHADLGIVVKPKKENDEMLLRSIKELNNFIEVLALQGRIIFLDRSKYPVEAGYASDIVIGVIPDTTAGLECALAGVPMVIYDCMNSGDSHPLYKSGHNRIIFDDVHYLIEAINLNRQKPGSIVGFADWADILSLTDPFRDGRANYRIASYIKTLLLKLSNGTGKYQAIRAANEFYKEKFGSDRVVTLN